MSEAQGTLLSVRNLSMFYPVRGRLPAGAQGGGPGRRRCFVRHPGRRNPGPGGRERLWQDHHGPLHPARRGTTAGELWYHPREGEPVDLARLDTGGLLPWRQEIRMIFQDPFASLNPRLTVLEIVGESLKVNRGLRRSALEERVAELLGMVGLRPEYMRRYPHAFSGGERQRIGIARALALNPRLVVADEAVSALDVSVRSQTLNLLQDLQNEMQLTYLFISHDLSVIRYVCNRVAVMYVGKLVELADTRSLFLTPQHPYTEALLSSVPKPDPRVRSQRIVLEGDVPDPSQPPSGCHFHPRCRYAVDRCAEETPPLRETADGHHVACHLADEIELVGIHG